MEASVRALGWGPLQETSAGGAVRTTEDALLGRLQVLVEADVQSCRVVVKELGWGMWNAWRNIEATSGYEQPSARHCPEGEPGADTDVHEWDRPRSWRPILLPL